MKKIMWCMAFLYMDMMCEFVIGMEMNATPVRSEYITGESIQIELQFENREEKNVSAFFPALKVRIMDSRTTTNIPENWLVRHVEGGLKSRGYFLIDIPPLRIRKINLFLDHFIRVEEPGVYTIEFALDESTTTTEITLVPETPERLRGLQALYAEKWEQVEHSEEEVDPALITFFSLSRHRLALPYQIKLYKSEIFDFLDWDERLEIAKALMASQQVEAIAPLIHDLRPESTRLLTDKERIFVEFRKAGALEWSGELYSFIEPFRLDIESAIEYFMGD